MMALRQFLFYFTVKYCAVRISEGQFLASYHISFISPENITGSTIQEFTMTPDFEELDVNVTEIDGLARLFTKIDLPLYKSDIHKTRNFDTFATTFSNGASNVDNSLSFRQLVNKYGCEFERHEVLSKDGYLLTMFRIPGEGPPVFLMHGLLGSADDFILAGPNSGLVYLLANNKYDVWLGNARGNKYCLKHNFLNIAEALFWNFSWHEIGIYDLPAMIDYVLRTSNRRSLNYIGYSLGSTAFFVMASEIPEYNEKVSLMIALSPATFMTKVRSPIIRLLALSSSLLYEMSDNVGLYEFQPSNKLKKMLRLLICGKGKLSETVCSNLIFLISGVDSAQLNISNLPQIFSHYPSGGAIKQFTHYAQGLLHEDFIKFDHGSMENLVKYGTIVPPSYTLQKVVTRIALFYSDSDWLSDPKDVELLSLRLNNLVYIHRIPNDKFNHADFIIARDVNKLVYTRVLKVLTRFAN